MARHGENIYKRKDGRYEGRYVTGKTHHNKTRFGYVYGKTYREVQLRLIQLKAEAHRICPEQDPRAAQRYAVWERSWLHASVRHQVRPSTFACYLNTMGHVLRHIGHIPLGALTADDIRTLLLSLEQQGLARSTCQGVLRLLRSSLRAAVEEGVLRRDPSRGLKLPSAVRQEQRVLSRSEQAQLRTALSDTGDLSSLIALYMGLRVGEVCGLMWQDINWQAGTLCVRRTVQRCLRTGQPGTQKTAVMVGSPKTLASGRIMPIPAFLLELLRARFEAQNAQDGYLFVSAGRQAEPRALQRRLSRTLMRLGLTGVHFHTLRHTFATRLLELSIDVKTISLLLGHSSVRVTLDCYAHSTLDQRRCAIGRLAAS